MCTGGSNLGFKPQVQVRVWVRGPYDGNTSSSRWVSASPRYSRGAILNCSMLKRITSILCAGWFIQLGGIFVIKNKQYLGRQPLFSLAALCEADFIIHCFSQGIAASKNLPGSKPRRILSSHQFLLIHSQHPLEFFSTTLNLTSLFSYNINSIY